jgi:DNA-binding Lrp family transcriptional regulator
MDDLTKQIIAVLRRDGRMSYSDIARILDTNRDNVASRITPLLESGQVRVIAAPHPQVLGLIVSAHLSLKVRGDTRTVVEQLERMDAPVFISLAAGAYQIIVETRQANLHELVREVTNIRALKGVVEVHVLLYERVFSSFFHGERPEVATHKFDDLDIDIIALLQVDGRASYADLAQKVGLSLSGCRTRVLSLLESGVIQIGAIKQRSDMTDDFMFGIGINTDGDFEAITKVLATGSGLEFLARTVGRFDLLATVGFNSLRGFNDLITRLRAVPSVTYCEQWLHVQIVRERYQYPIKSLKGNTRNGDTDIH